MRKLILILASVTFVASTATGCGLIGGNQEAQAKSVCQDFAVFLLDVGDGRFAEGEMQGRMVDLQERAAQTGDSALSRYFAGMYNSATDDWGSLGDFISMTQRIAETCKTYGVPIATEAP